jgi:hypothetical protein
MLVYLIGLISFVIIFTQYAYAIEIITAPEKDPFGPNDSISISVEIDGYQGGIVEWIAHKPDGSSDSGVLTALKGGKKTHVIGRTAFDNQFGAWSIDYIYKDITHPTPVNVAPLVLELTTDKQVYHEGETVFVTINSNEIELNAAKAETYYIEIVDSNDSPAQHMQSNEIKAYQNFTTYSILVNELLHNNPFGDYKAKVQYYKVISYVTFSVKEEGPETTIFIGTDKSLYDSGAIVEVQIIISEIIDSNAELTIIDPTGKRTVRSFPIENSLTRVILDDVSTIQSGTYTLQISYGGISELKTFVVETESTVSKQPKIDLRVSLDKGKYSPGEVITAEVKTDQLIANNISYWTVDPSSNQGVVTTKSMSSGKSIIPYFLPSEVELGPWKFYVNYGGKESFTIFFVEDEPIGQTKTIPTDTYEGPELLMTIDKSITNLNQLKGIAIDSNQHIFLVDSGSSMIKKFDVNGRLLDSWGSFGSEEGQFKNPTGILVDSKYVHVADTDNSRIQTFDKDGKFIRSWGKSGIGSQSLKSPVSISTDSSGIFLVSDSSLDKISKYDSDGGYAGHIESILTASAKFYSSNSIVADKNDNILILITADNRILQYHSDGTFINSFGTTGEDDGKFQSPSALALDSKGNLYVADSGNSRIQVFDPSKKFLTKWGSLGSQAGQFNTISGIAVDSRGNVFVVDSTNGVVQKFASISQQSELDIPAWVRNNAQWWNEGTIGDSDFANGIQYMIQNEIIFIPDLGQSGASQEQQIPDWVKKNAGWWAAGQISDEEFANGIEFLVTKGIIQV